MLGLVLVFVLCLAGLATGTPALAGGPEAALRLAGSTPPLGDMLVLIGLAAIAWSLRFL